MANHRDNDLPAVIFSNGRQEWYRMASNTEIMTYLRLYIETAPKNGLKMDGDTEITVSRQLYVQMAVKNGIRMEDHTEKMVQNRKGLGFATLQHFPCTVPKKRILRLDNVNQNNFEDNLLFSKLALK